MQCTAGLIEPARSSDSAIIEPIDGTLVIHQGRELPVMTDPTFAEQWKNLENYRAYGGDLPRDGGIFSTDRFVPVGVHGQ